MHREAHTTPTAARPGKHDGPHDGAFGIPDEGTTRPRDRRRRRLWWVLAAAAAPWATTAAILLAERLA